MSVSEKPDTETIAKILAVNVSRELHRLDPDAAEDIDVSGRTGQRSRSDPVQPVVEISIESEEASDFVSDVVPTQDIPCVVDWVSFKRSETYDSVRWNFVVMISVDDIMSLVEHLEEQGGDEL